MARDVERNAPDGLETLAAHAGGLRALAFELVGDPHAAEDVLQDTFVRALARPPTGASSAGLRAWLREVVRGLALNHRRNAAHRSEREAAYARCRRLATVASGVFVRAAISAGERPSK